MDVAQETERNYAAARHSLARQHTWLLLSFSPFPVRHTLLQPCRPTSFRARNTSKVFFSILFYWKGNSPENIHLNLFHDLTPHIVQYFDFDAHCYRFPVALPNSPTPRSPACPSPSTASTTADSCGLPTGWSLTTWRGWSERSTAPQGRYSVLSWDSWHWREISLQFFGSVRHLKYSINRLYCYQIRCKIG